MRHIGRGPILAASLLAILAAMSGCGSRQPLKREAGAKPVPVAIGAKEPASSGDLMKPSVQARPDRTAEPLTKSQERQDDPFSLPPT